MHRLVLSVLLVSAVSCKGGGVEGTYTLDKAVMAKAMDEKLATLPPEQKAMGQMAAEMLKLMDIRLTLHGGGKGEMTMTMPALGGDQPKVKTEPIAWEKKDDGIELRGKDKPIRCRLDGARLRCSQGSEQELVFARS